MVKPHSNPAFTSLTSFLNRFSVLDLAGMDHDVVAQHPHFAVARMHAIQHHAAGHVADLADAEYFAHFGRGPGTLP